MYLLEGLGEGESGVHDTLPALEANDSPEDSVVRMLELGEGVCA